MNGHNAFYPLIEGVAGKFGLQVDRNEAGMPVVAVDDVRPEAQRRQYAQNGFAEETEFLDIVVVIGVRVTAAEILFIIDEIVDDAVADKLFHADVTVTAVEKRLEIADRSHFIPVFLGNDGVRGDHDADFKLITVKDLRE